MIQTNYIDTIDELEICFKDEKVPIVKKLSNNVEFEFNSNNDLTKIVLPKFCQMMHRQYPPDTIFQYDHAIFDKNHVTMIIQVNNQPIKVRVDLSELDK